MGRSIAPCLVKAEEELERVRHRLDLFRASAMEGELSPVEGASEGRRQAALGFLVADLVQVNKPNRS